MVKVKYPIFQEASIWTNIPFWKETLEQCSLGKFPKGMSVSKNVIYINNTKTKKNILRYDLPTDPKEVCALCKNIFTDTLGLKSSKDLSVDMENFKTTQKEFKNKVFTDFKDASLKIQREHLIDNYIIKVSKEKKLKTQDMKNLKNAIYVGWYMKKIKKFEFEDGEISSIPSLSLKKTKEGLIVKFLEK